MLLLKRVLLILVATLASTYCAGTDDALGCPGICPSGQLSFFPDVKVVGNFTCGDYDTFLQTSAFNETDCLYMQQAFGIICGCQELTVDTLPSCSGICSDGQKPRNADSFLFENSTCGDYDYLLTLYVYNETECAYVQQTYGNYCGCGDDFQITTCLGICLDGQPPVYPDATISEFNVTCREANYLLPLHVSNETECKAIQHAFGASRCGCIEVAPTCPGLCFDGQPPMYPDNTLSEDFTCGDLDAYLPLNVLNETECASMQYTYAQMCGCTEVHKDIPFPSCSGICSNGQRPQQPNATISGDLTCGNYDSFISLYITNETVCAFIQESYGVHCGCQDDYAAICSGICSDGQPPVYPDATIFELNVTCQEANRLLHHYVSEEAQCKAMQYAFGASRCGCAEVTPTCSGICNNGQPPLYPNAVILEHNVTCEEADQLLPLYVFNSTECTEIQYSFGETYCGCTQVTPPCSGLCLESPGQPQAIPLTTSPTKPVSAPSDDLTFDPRSPRPSIKEAIRIPITSALTPRPTAAVTSTSHPTVTIAITPHPTASKATTPLPIASLTNRPDNPVNRVPIAPITSGPTPLSTRSPITFQPASSKTVAPVILVTPRPMIPIVVSPVTLVTTRPTFAVTLSPMVKIPISAVTTLPSIYDSIAPSTHVSQQTCRLCFADGLVPEASRTIILTLMNGTRTSCGDYEASIKDLNTIECSVDPNKSAGLPYLCGCPNAKLPADAVGCTLCANGAVSNSTLTLPSGLTCGELNFTLAVANQTVCGVARSSEEAWLCGCNGVKAPVTITPIVTSSPSVINGTLAPVESLAPVPFLTATRTPLGLKASPTGTPAKISSATGLNMAATTGLVSLTFLYGLAALLVF